jgi:hypothetical protein
MSSGSASSCSAGVRSDEGDRCELVLKWMHRWIACSTGAICVRSDPLLVLVTDKIPNKSGMPFTTVEQISVDQAV